MNRYTLEERAEIVILFIKNNESVISTQRNFRRNYPHRPAPTGKTIRRLCEQFRRSGTTAHASHIGRPRTGRSIENIRRVRESIAEDPRTSTERRATQLGMSRTSLRRILKLDLHAFPYKIQVAQQLLPRDHQQRLQYCHSLLNVNDNIDDFPHKLIMTDEAHFNLSGFVNKQNYRYWGTENPRILQERPLHPSRVTVWCGVFAQGVIGPYFFEDDEGTAVTVNGERYRAMLNNFLSPQLEVLGLEDMWLQQDDATAHTSRETMAILRNMFPARLISRFGDLAWPARSPDLSAPDFFLWGYLKGKVYANNPRTLQQLKHNIRQEIEDLTPNVLTRVMEHAVKRAQLCIAVRGGHLTDVIFN